MRLTISLLYYMREQMFYQPRIAMSQPAQLAETEAGRVVRATGMDVPTGIPLGNFTIPAHARVSILLDNLQLTTANPALSVNGGEGSTVRLTYSEALVDDRGEKGNRNQIE